MVMAMVIMMIMVIKMIILIIMMIIVMIRKIMVMMIMVMTGDNFINNSNRNDIFQITRVCQYMSWQMKLYYTEGLMH